MYALNFSAMYLKFSVKTANETISADYENVNLVNILLQTFPVYNELMTVYIPQEKPKNKFAVQLKYFLHIIYFQS